MTFEPKFAFQFYGPGPAPGFHPPMLPTVQPRVPPTVPPFLAAEPSSAGAKSSEPQGVHYDFSGATITPDQVIDHDLQDTPTGSASGQDGSLNGTIDVTLDATLDATLDGTLDTTLDANLDGSLNGTLSDKTGDGPRFTGDLSGTMDQFHSETSLGNGQFTLEPISEGATRNSDGSVSETLDDLNQSESTEEPESDQSRDEKDLDADAIPEGGKQTQEDEPLNGEGQEQVIEMEPMVITADPPEKKRGGGGGGGGYPTIEGVTQQIRRDTQAIQPQRPALPIDQLAPVAAAVQQTNDGQRPELRRQADGHIQTPNDLQGAIGEITADPPPDPLPSVTSLLERRAKRRVTAYALPAFVASPATKLMPQMGSRPLSRGDMRAMLALPAPPTADQLISEPDPLDPTQPSERTQRILAQEALRERRDLLLKKPEDPQTVQGEPTGLPVQGATQPPPVNPAARTPIRDVIATLLAKSDTEAMDLYNQVRRVAILPGAMRALQKPEALGEEEYKAEFKQYFSTKLRDIASKAGVSAEELDKRVKDLQKEAQEGADDNQSQLDQRNETTREQVDSSHTGIRGFIRGLSQRNEQHAEKAAAARNGEGSAAHIIATKNRLLQQAYAKVGRGKAGYRLMKRDRKAALDKLKRDGLDAYKATKQKEELAWSKKNPGATTAQLQAAMKANKVDEWYNTQTTGLTTNVNARKEREELTIDTFIRDMDSTGESATAAIRKWADEETGHHRSWWDKLIDRIVDWMNQAQADTREWESLQNQATAAALQGDMAMLHRMHTLAVGQNQEAFRAAMADLDADQKAIVSAYFQSIQQNGITKADPIGAVVVGLRRRLKTERTQPISDALKQRLISRGGWKDLQIVGAMQKEGFSAADPGQKIHYAMFGGTGIGTDEEDIYKALTGLTKIQLAALKKWYKFRYNRDLDADIRSEMSGSELQRAKSLMEGDVATAAAAALYYAMHGGTGIGTDEDAIMNTLRGKSASERAEIKRRYRELYGRNLRSDLNSELNDGWDMPAAGTRSSHDYLRATSYLDGNTARGDAMGIDRAMNGGFSGAGTDEQAVYGIYKQIINDVKALGRKEGWSTGQIDCEVRRRMRAVEREYKLSFGRYYGSLSQELKDEFSGAELDLANSYQAYDKTGIDAAQLGIERESWYVGDKEVNNVFDNQRSRAEEEVKRDQGPEVRTQITGQITALSQRIAAFNSNPDNQTGDNRPMPFTLEALLSHPGLTPAEKALVTQMRDLGFSQVPVGDSKEWGVYENRALGRMVDRNLQPAIDAATKTNFNAMENRFNAKYYNGASYGLTLFVAFGTSGVSGERAMAAVRQDGVLTDVQRIDFATRGAGTDENEIRNVLKGKTRAEIARLRQDWKKKFPNGESLDQRIYNDTSGRDRQDFSIQLMGEPANPQEALEVSNAKKKYEEANTSTFGGATQRRVMEGQHEQLAKAAAEWQSAEDQIKNLEGQWSTWDNSKRDPHSGRTAFEDFKELIGEQRRIESRVASAETGFNTSIDMVRKQADAVVDVLSQAVGIVITVVTIIAAAIAAPFSGGASLAVALAVAGALMGTMANMAIKTVMLGDAYGWEDIATDIALGVVDAAVSALTAGMGGRLLGQVQQRAVATGRQMAGRGIRGALARGMTRFTQGAARLGDMGPMAKAMRPVGFLQNMAESPSVWKRTAANLLDETAENVVGSTPSTLLGATLNDRNWEGPGNPFTNILKETGMGVGQGALMGLAQSQGMNLAQRGATSAWNFARGPKLHGDANFGDLHGSLPRNADEWDVNLQRHLDAGGSPQDHLLGMAQHLPPDVDVPRTVADYEAAWRDFKQGRPNATEADFINHYRGTALESIDGAIVRQAQRAQMAESLAETLPPGDRDALDGVPLQVVSPSEFVRLQGLNSGGGVGVVVRDGQVHIVVRDGANPSPEALAKAARQVRDLVEPGTGGRTKDPKESLPRDLRNRLPVWVNPELPPGSVQVQYQHADDGTVIGVWLEVGAKATASDIKRHMDTARSIRKYAGLSGEVQKIRSKLAEFFGSHGSPKPGSTGFEAELELQKLPRLIQDRMAEIQSLGVSPERKAIIEAEIQQLQDQVQHHQIRLEHLADNPGLGYVAAEVGPTPTEKTTLAIKDAIREEGASGIPKVLLSDGDEMPLLGPSKNLVETLLEIQGTVGGAVRVELVFNDVGNNPRTMTIGVEADGTIAYLGHDSLGMYCQKRFPNMNEFLKFSSELEKARARLANPFGISEEKTGISGIFDKVLSESMNSDQIMEAAASFHGSSSSKDAKLDMTGGPERLLGYILYFKQRESMKEGSFVASRTSFVVELIAGTYVYHTHKNPSSSNLYTEFVTGGDGSKYYVLAERIQQFIQDRDIEPHRLTSLLEQFIRGEPMDEFINEFKSWSWETKEKTGIGFTRDELDAQQLRHDFLEMESFDRALFYERLMEVFNQQNFKNQSEFITDVDVFLQFAFEGSDYRRQLWEHERMSLEAQRLRMQWEETNWQRFMDDGSLTKKEFNESFIQMYNDLVAVSGGIMPTKIIAFNKAIVEVNPIIKDEMGRIWENIKRYRNPETKPKTKDSPQMSIEKVSARIDSLTRMVNDFDANLGSIFGTSVKGENRLLTILHLISTNESFRNPRNLLHLAMSMDLVEGGNTLLNGKIVEWPDVFALSMGNGLYHTVTEGANGKKKVISHGGILPMTMEGALQAYADLEVMRRYINNEGPKPKKITSEMLSLMEQESFLTDKWLLRFEFGHQYSVGVVDKLRKDFPKLSDSSAKILVLFNERLFAQHGLKVDLSSIANKISQMESIWDKASGVDSKHLQWVKQATIIHELTQAMIHHSAVNEYAKFMGFFGGKLKSGADGIVNSSIPFFEGVGVLALIQHMQEYQAIAKDDMFVSMLQHYLGHGDYHAYMEVGPDLFNGSIMNGIGRYAEMNKLLTTVRGGKSSSLVRNTKAGDAVIADALIAIMRGDPLPDPFSVAPGDKPSKAVGNATAQMVRLTMLLGGWESVRNPHNLMHVGMALQLVKAGELRLDEALRLHHEHENSPGGVIPMTMVGASKAMSDPNSPEGGIYAERERALIKMWLEYRMSKGHLPPGDPPYPVGEITDEIFDRYLTNLLNTEAGKDYMHMQVQLMWQDTFGSAASPS